MTRVRRPNVNVHLDRDPTEQLEQTLRGKKIQWVNSITGKNETELIDAHISHLSVEDRDDNPLHRIVHFIGPTGFRSVRLSAIKEVTWP